MTRWDYEISIALWIASLFAAVVFLPAMLLVIATTVNLYHQRRIAHEAGKEFVRRVHEALDEKLGAFDARIVTTERGVADVKEAQVRIAGQFRGRSLP